MCATALREVRGQLLELVHSFPFNVGSRDRTLVARLVWQVHVTSPKLDICFCFLDRVSLCSSGWPETREADQAGLKLTEPLASAP